MLGPPQVGQNRNYLKCSAEVPGKREIPDARNKRGLTPAENSLPYFWGEDRGTAGACAQVYVETGDSLGSMPKSSVRTNPRAWIKWISHIPDPHAGL